MFVASDPSAAKLTPQNFRRFADLITRELGIKMSEQKIPMLQGRLQRRLRALDLPSLEAYQAYLFDPANGGRELADFIDAVTTNKTDFLREPKHFDYLAEQVLPALEPDPTRRLEVKIWCAGCSTGQEAYTLAMVLSEYGERRPIQAAQWGKYPGRGYSPNPGQPPFLGICRDGDR